MYVNANGRHHPQREKTMSLVLRMIVASLVAIVLLAVPQSAAAQGGRRVRLMQRTSRLLVRASAM